MAKLYNTKWFTPEEVEQGLMTDLLNYLLDYNKKCKEYYYDIHITTDGYCTGIEWLDISYDNDEEYGSFQFVDSNQYILTEKQLPDKTYQYFHDEEEYNDFLNDWLKENPNYKKNEWGVWYDENEQKEFEEELKKGKENDDDIEG